MNISQLTTQMHVLISVPMVREVGDFLKIDRLAKEAMKSAGKQEVREYRRVRLLVLKNRFKTLDLGESRNSYLRILFSGLIRAGEHRSLVDMVISAPVSEKDYYYKSAAIAYAKADQLIMLLEYIPLISDKSIQRAAIRASAKNLPLESVFHFLKILQRKKLSIDFLDILAERLKLRV